MERLVKDIKLQQINLGLNMPLWFWLILTLLIACMFCWLISPNTNIRATKLQKIIALTWILFRQIVSFVAAIFGMFCIYVVWESTGTITNKIVGTVIESRTDTPILLI